MYITRVGPPYGRDILYLWYRLLFCMILWFEFLVCIVREAKMDDNDLYLKLSIRLMVWPDEGLYVVDLFCLSISLYINLCPWDLLRRASPAFVPVSHLTEPRLLFSGRESYDGPISSANIFSLIWCIIYLLCYGWLSILNSYVDMVTK